MRTAPAESQLARVEAAYAKWVAFKITTVAASLPEFLAQARHLYAVKLAIENKLVTLKPLGIDRQMAAKLRFGDVQLGYVLKLGSIPLPTFLSADSAVLALSRAVPNWNVLPFLDEAKRNWVGVVAFAKRVGISNTWSRLARENLGREFPSEFPPFHQEIVEGTDAP